MLGRTNYLNMPKTCWKRLRCFETCCEGLTHFESWLKHLKHMQRNEMLWNMVETCLKFVDKEWDFYEKDLDVLKHFVKVSHTLNLGWNILNTCKGTKCFEIWLKHA